MIAKASAIQHGQAMTNYATKNNRADIVKTNHLSEGLPPMGMWDEMVLHQSMFKQRYAKKPIELTSIRFELSPSEEEARNWTMEDWRRFLDEFIREMDGISKVNHIDKKKGKAATSVKPTNIANSQYFAALHRDSKSGIPHLHLVVNRIDMDGNLNDVKFIGERAVMAAKAINQRHGWKDAMDIRQERIAEVTKACMDVLRSMPFFDWDEYADRLRAKGYDIELIRDKNGQGRVHGYRFKFGKTTIKASELGVGRNLTASKIGNTFRKLHPQPTPVAVGQRPSPSVSNATTLDSRNTASQGGLSRTSNVAKPDLPAGLRKIIEVDGERFSIVMPRTAYDTMNSCIEVPENGSASHTDILNVAMLLFMNYLDAATSMSESCGGGGSPGSGWGRDKDDDDREWARRCAMQANTLCKPIKRGMNDNFSNKNGMGRNKKDATQDVLNLYNQMQEDENIESGKEEIKVTLKEIESAKKALYEAKEELGNAYRRLESTKVALMAAHRSTDNIVDSICHAIVKAEQSNLKVGINDEGVAQLDKRNNTAISAFKQALDEHEKRINDLFTHQQKELKRIRNIEEGAYFNGSTYAWMFGLAFLSWSIIFVEITIWICITLFRKLKTSES